MNERITGKNCVVRTYSAGVHIGRVEEINEQNQKCCYLTNAYRLWSWSDGGLSLSAIARKGVKSARINRTDEIMLTEAIEYIPINDKAFATLDDHLEDE